LRRDTSRPPGRSFHDLPPASRAILLALLVVFVVAGSTRTYGRNSGSAWAFWAGDILLRVEFLASGAIILALSFFDPGFPREMRSLRGNPVRHIPGERLKWAIIGLAAATIGVFLVINGLQHLLSGCEPPGC